MLKRFLITITLTFVAFGCTPVADTPTPLPTPTSTPTPTPTPQPIDLTVLHTNDTVGYTKPCG
jgi:2',3'-cyclic-nucleotide 2'-phosphodiesterase (5'-nucleotidase family)